MRILIADDHEVVRSGLRRILLSQPNWEVVAEAADGKDAISKATETKPDIAILDYSLPRINGMEATRQIRARLPKTEVLIFTMHDSEALIQELLKAGARGYLLKIGCHASPHSCHRVAGSAQAFLHRQGLRAIARHLFGAAGAGGIGSHQSRARRGATDCRGSYQQADRPHSQYQPQDGRDASKRDHAQAVAVIERRSRALCDPQSAG